MTQFSLDLTKSNAAYFGGNDYNQEPVLENSDFPQTDVGCKKLDMYYKT